MKPYDSLREELQGILAGKEYRIYYSERQNILANLWRSLKNWLSQLLKAYLPQGAGEKSADWLAYGILVAGVLLIFLLLVGLSARFVRRVKIKRSKAGRGQGTAPAGQNHLAEARGWAERGEYGRALRSLFLSFLFFLDQNQWIEAKAWKTNWEYYDELQSRAPQLADSFFILAVKFEEAMYGGRSIAGEDYWLLHEQVNKWLGKGGEPA